MIKLMIEEFKRIKILELDNRILFIQIMIEMLA